MRTTWYATRLRPAAEEPRSRGWLGFLGLLGLSGFQNPFGFAFFGFFLFFRYFLPRRPASR